MNNRRTILNVAFLTAGGMAPCLSSTIATLIEEYTKYRNDIQYFGYLYGYKGLLTGAKVTIPTHPLISELKKYGGSFLVMNSYGQKFGIKGKIWIKYKHIKKLKGDRVISISCNKEIYESEDGSPNYLNQLTSKKFKQSFFPLYRNNARKEVRSIPVFKYINSSPETRCIFK